MSTEISDNKEVFASEKGSDDVPMPTGAMDLNARRRAALAEIDNAKFSWFHVRTVLVAGVGFYVSAFTVAGSSRALSRENDD